MAMRRQEVPEALEDLDPMSDMRAVGEGVQVRTHTGSDGKKSVSIQPRAFARLSEEGHEVMADLQRTAFELQEIREKLEALVIEARNVGASWALIGWSLGTSGDAARQRWGDL
jgi:hypothetical protein